MIHVAHFLATAVAVTMLLILGVGFGSSWCRSVLIAWDYLCAAILGGDGEHSISAYVGGHITPGWRVLEPLIDRVFGEGHCFRAAATEGLLP